MNKLMTILSVAAVAGTALAQNVVVLDKTECLDGANVAHLEGLTALREHRMHFAGIQDGKVRVPLTMGGDENATIEINADDVQISVRQDGSHVIVEMDGAVVYDGEIDGDFETFTLSSADGETEVELINAGENHGAVFLERFGAHGEEIELHVQRAIEMAGQAHEHAGHFALAFGDHSSPKVMMGVTLESVGESVAKQLGIDATQATLIGTVMDGLPASKAGLEQYDIVVGVDGAKVADPNGIREAIADKEPGDQLVLDVLREGRRQQVVLDLEAYDAGSLGVNISRNFSFAPQVELDPEQAEKRFGEWLEKLVDERAELQASLRRASGKELTELKEQSAELSEQISKMREQIAKGDFTMPFGQNAWTWSPEDMDFEFNIDLQNMPHVQFAPHADGSRAFVVPGGEGNAEIRVLVEQLELSAEQNGAQVEQLETRIIELEIMLETAVEELKSSKKGPDA
jgi:hypothetical protein